MRLGDYKTLVFDCDGVVLNSNKVKTRAFYNAALAYGEQAAEALVAYHVANGGISRFRKFELFLDQIVPRGAKGPGLEELLATYAEEARQGLLNCEVAAGLEELRRRTADARWLIVSGGAQAELREVFAHRGLARLFDGGIFGSPDTKETILQREISSGNLVRPAVFLGDSRYDHHAADQSALDFIFVSQWTEFSTWIDYCKTHSLKSIHQPIDSIFLS